MKYMTFNSSCSYAGLANLLEKYDVDTEDHLIALQMNLPYFFIKKNGYYLSGPMLQCARWFNLYLNPIGWEMKEKDVLREAVPNYLKEQHCAMLGIRISESAKHAMVYWKHDQQGFHFINNKHKDDRCEAYLCFSEEELLEKLDDTTMIATLHKCEPHEVNIDMHLRTSLETLSDMKKALDAFLSSEREPNEVRARLNILFRPIFLDGIGMMQMIGETKLADDMSSLQTSLMQLVRSNARAIPYDYVSKDLLHQVIDRLILLVERRIATLVH